jgi:ketosteroid isomerase-like protein
MSRDKVEPVKRAVDAYNRRDVDTFFAELATPDFEWFPALTRAFEGGGYRGREGVERFQADTRENWEELQTLPEEFRDLGDRVLVLGSGAPGTTWIAPRLCERPDSASRRCTRHL